MKKRIRISAALLLAMFLLGCGQSGPLYVTGNPSEIQPAASPSGAEDEKDADESDDQ
jgi:predicted small lipoprotein YifL